MRELQSAAAIVIAGVMFHALSAVAQTYPSKPIRMIVPFAPGGASDLVGRVISPRLAHELGQQIVVDNRAGADGNIGVGVAGRSTPDGYTLLLGNVGSMSINPGLYPDFPLKPVRDFISVTQIVDVPAVLVVHPSLRISSVKELIEYAKARPGKLNFGSPGSSAATRLEMEFFMRAAGIKMMHIPYKGGGGQAVTALVAGETSVMFTLGSVIMPFVKSGRLKLLGVLARSRMAAFPEVPTMAEAGFATMTTGSWQGVFLPAATPRPVVSRVFAAATATMQYPEVSKRLTEAGVDVVISKSPEEFATFVRQQNERWEKVIREAGIVAE